MAKEKTSTIEESKKEFTFLYEVLGIVAILISLISLTRLGIVGKYGMLTFRLLFGDWYFIFLVLLAALGIYFLFVHRSLQIKNIRYLGILLILIALITLTHFSMHNFVTKLEGNELSNTFLLYLDYFKNGRSEMLVGGGIIGALLFYLSYFLLSKTGTIIVNVILIFVGCVFITKKTIVEFFQMMGKWFKKTFGGAMHLSSNLKKVFKKFNNDYTVKEKNNKQYKIKYLNDSSISSKEQERVSLENLKKIKKALDHLNIFYQNVDYLLCSHISVYFVKSLQKINFEVFRITLKKTISDPFLIRYDKEHNIVIIEVNNKIINHISMKQIVEKNLSGIVLGLDDRNEYINTLENIIIISDNNNLYRYYLSTLILYSHFLTRCENENYTLIDLNNNLSMLNFCVNKYENEITYFKTLKEEVDKIIDKLNKGNASTIEEYNKKSKDKIKKNYIFINGIEKIYENEEIVKIFEYLLMTTNVIGFQIIVGLTSNKVLKNEKIRLFNYKLFLKNNFDYTTNTIGYGMMDVINKNSEGFLKYKEMLIRLNLVLITPEEIDKIKK